MKNSYSNDVIIFVLKNLIKYSHSKLIADESFVEYTGLNSAHALANYIKKHKITMQDVYRYGIDNGFIRYEISFVDWLEMTGRKGVATTYKKKGYNSATDVYNRILPETDLEQNPELLEVQCIKNIATKFDIIITDSTDIKIVNLLVLDLLGGDLSELMKLISKEKTKILKEVKRKKLEQSKFK